MTAARPTFSCSPRSATAFLGDAPVAARYVTGGQLAGSHTASSHTASSRAMTSRATNEHRPYRNTGGHAVHEHNVLALYTGGRARMEQRGSWELGPGDMLLVPAGEPHRLLEASHAEYWGLAFVAAGEAAHGSPLLEPFDRVREGGAAVVRIPAERHELLHTLFRELERASGARPAADAVEVAVRHSLLTLILGEVARATRAAPPQLAGAAGQGVSSYGVVSQALRFIERNCLRRLTLDEVAAAVGRSPAYVTSALSRATGRSASLWILAFRMTEARRLLLHSELPVEAIAERIGYADSTHFVRMFRREHRQTPAAWRAEQRR
jgi:AraC-like DNA-binding protein